MPTNKKGRYLLFMFDRETTIEHQGNNLLTKEMNLSLSVDTKTFEKILSEI